MGKNEYRTYEIVENEENLPYTIYVHTQEKMRQDGHVDEQGNLVVPKLLEHWHKELEINYVLDGTCVYSVNGEKITVTAGEMIVINSEDIHSVEVDFDSIQKNVFGFTLLLQEDFLKSMVPDLDQCIFVNEIVSDSGKAKEILMEIYGHFTQQRTKYEKILIQGLIHCLIYEFCAAGGKKEKSIVPINSQKNVERLRGVMQYVKQHYTEPVTQEETAARFYFSRGYFAKFFKHYTGMTFKEYVTRYRLEKAMELLKTDELNVTEIAMYAGFSDVRRFILACKKYYGITPCQYKKKITQSR